ncbi:MAG: TIR domain-containing protein [Bacteroidia bacterium]
MAYTPEYTHDVFISYAHIDDEPDSLSADAKGWISNFHTLLQRRLNKVVGKELKIWRDEKLQGNTVFGPEIEERLTKMKMMVSILTPRYVESDWCRREMDSFHKAASGHGGFSINNQARIFKVVKTPFDRSVIDELPEEVNKIFKDILDYKFYIQESEDRFSELTPEGSVDNPSTQIFMQKLDDVVQNIAKLFKQFNNKDQLVIHQHKIYLAETTYDLQPYRDALVRELQDAGYDVLPDKPLPSVINKFTADVEAYIDQSILSVHLISSTNYATIPEGADQSSVILQNEIASQKSASKNLNRLIWIPPATADASTNAKTIALQSEFLKDLIDAKNNTQLGADILKGTLEEFKDAILTKAKKILADEKAKQDAIKEAEEKAKIVAATPVAPDAQATTVKKIYLICQEPDLDTTRPIEKLIQKSGYTVIVPNFDREPAVLQNEHNENLNICDAVLIYYGAGNYRWINKMIGDLSRLTKPLLAKVIYTTGADDDGDKKDFTSPDILLINGLTGFVPESFNDFFQKLK